MAAGLAMLVLGLAAVVMVLVAPTSTGESDGDDRRKRGDESGDYPVVGSPSAR